MYHVIGRINICANQVQLPKLLGVKPSMIDWSMAGNTLCDTITAKIHDIIEKDPEAIFLTGVLYPMEFVWIAGLCNEKNVTLLIAESDEMYMRRAKATISRVSSIYIYRSRKVPDKE